MQKLYAVMLCLVLTAGGCSLGPVKTNVRAVPGERMLNSNTGPVLVTECQVPGKGKQINVTAEDSYVQGPRRTTLNYTAIPFMFSSLPAVKAKLPNGKTYDAFIDTGFSEYVWMNELVLNENELSIYPLGNCTFSNASAGIAYLPWMKLGGMKVTNPPCRYQQLHWEFKLLGMPIWKQKTMLLGVKTLMQFSYVVFDNGNYRMMLCSDGKFTPDNPDEWSAYKMEIEPDSAQNLRVMVTMPLEGKDRKMMFDTCGGYGLMIHPALWKQVAHEFGETNLKQSKFISGFQGWLPCLKGNVSELQIGNTRISNAQLVVPDESTSYLGSVEAIFAMNYFKDTQVVLDNIRGLMWIKNF